MDSFTTTVAVYPTQLLRGLWDLYQRQVCCDLTILLQDGTTVHLHKVVLAAASGHFKSLLKQGQVTESWELPSRELVISTLTYLTIITSSGCYGKTTDI